MSNAAHFAITLGGRIGLWFNGYGAPMEAWLDNFGGGPVPLAATQVTSDEGFLPIDEPETGVPVIEAYVERVRDTTEWARVYAPVMKLQ